MSVQKVEVKMMVPKELKEIIDAVTGLVGHFIKGGDIAGALLLVPSVMTAVDGYEKVSEELKSDGQDEAAAYMVHKVWESLKKPAA